jgi:PPP family 3-phenylpropionic acid transporter
MSPDAAEREKRSFALRMSLLFAAICVIIGTNLPYLPVWLDWAGLGPREIAVITAVPLFVRVGVTPAIAFAADRSGDHRRFLIGLSWVALAALVVLAQVRGFWAIFALMLIFSLAWTTIMPLAETVAMSGVRAAGLDYGRMRLWGSLSFIAASFVGGWVVARLGAGSAIWLVVAGAGLTAAAAHGLARPAAPGRDAGAAQAPRLELAGALRLVRSPLFVTFLVAAGAVQASHAVLYTFGTLHWRALGLSTEWCGALWSIGVVAEIALFAASRAVVTRLGALGLLTVAAAASIGRWLAMGIDPPLALLLALQLLHGLTYGAAHLGAFHFVAQAAPERHTGAAQAVYAASTGGIAMGTVMLSTGPLYASLGGRAYWAMALLGVVGLAASLVLARLWARRPGAQPHSPGAGGERTGPA